MNNPKISVIVPVYNVEKYLRRCIDSILAQTFTDFELLLIDDGSKDSSGEICDEYAGKDERVRVFHKDNGGVSSARNLGLDNAKGEWIWFVDSDDVINPNIDLSSVLTNISDEDYVLFNGEEFSDDEDINQALFCKDFKVDKSYDKNEFLLKYVCHNHFLLWYKRSLIEKYGIRFTEGMKVAEDEEFQLKYLIICSHPIKVDGTLYFYRIRRESAMNNSKTYLDIQLCSEVLLNNISAFIINRKINDKWLFCRLESVLKQYLAASSHFRFYKWWKFQRQYRRLVNIVQQMHFPYKLNNKLKMAYYSVGLYILMFKTYQCLIQYIKK